MNSLYQLLKEENGPRTHLTLKLSDVSGMVELTMYTDDGAYVGVQLIALEMDNPAYIESEADWIRQDLKHLRANKDSEVPNEDRSKEGEHVPY